MRIMKIMRKIIALALCMATLITIGGTDISVVSAARAKSPWDYSATPTRSIYYTKPTMKGNDVKWVQQSLNIVIGAGLSVDGSYGPASKNATKKFQKQYGLSQDGSFGPATRSKMLAVLKNKGYTDGKSTTPSKSSSSKTLYINWNNIKKTGYQTVSGPCGCYALAYCRDIIDNKAHSWTEYSKEYLRSKKRYSYTAVWSKAGYVSKQGNSSTILRALYDNINAGKPVVVGLRYKDKYGKTHSHYVAVVGYTNVTNVNALTLKNFLIIDSSTKNCTSTENLGTSKFGYYLSGQYIVKK